MGISVEDKMIIDKMILNPLGVLKTENSTGLGLGFRMAYALLKILSYKKGQMVIESKINQGTKISFKIRKLKNTNIINRHHSDIDNVVTKVKYFLEEPTQELKTNLRSLITESVNISEDEENKDWSNYQVDLEDINPLTRRMTRTMYIETQRSIGIGHEHSRNMIFRNKFDSAGRKSSATEKTREFTKNTVDHKSGEKGPSRLVLGRPDSIGKKGFVNIISETTSDKTNNEGFKSGHKINTN